MDGPSGRRLERLLGIEEGQLHRAARVVNLIPWWPGPSASGKGDRFPSSSARLAASRVRLRGTVLLAGRGVARAFGVRAPFFEWARVGPARVAVIPHPSGVSRWWNEPANLERAERFMRAITGG